MTTEGRQELLNSLLALTSYTPPRANNDGHNSSAEGSDAYDSANGGGYSSSASMSSESSIRVVASDKRVHSTLSQSFPDALAAAEDMAINAAHSVRADFWRIFAPFSTRDFFNPSLELKFFAIYSSCLVVSTEARTFQEDA